MWIGTSKGGNFAKLLGLGKDSKEAYFEMSNGEIWNFIEGYLDSIELSSYEYEGKQREVMIRHLKDEDSSFDLSTSFTRTSRTFINCLASVPKIDGIVRLSVYTTEKDWKIYKNWSLFHGWQKWDRKHDRESQKKLTRVIEDPETKEYIKTDYTKLNDMMKDEIKAINKKITKKEFEVEEEPF